MASESLRAEWCHGGSREPCGCSAWAGSREESPGGRWKVFYADLGRLSREIEEAILRLINPPGGGLRDVRRVEPPPEPEEPEQPKLGE